MKQYVYLVRAHNGKGTCKIGLTSNPSDRFKALKVHGADVLKLVETADMRILEKSLHSKFASSRVPQSEMFDLSDAEINECKQIMDRYALSSYVKPRKPVSKNNSRPLNASDSGNALGEGIDFLFGLIGSLVIAAPFILLFVVGYYLWAIAVVSFWTKVIPDPEELGLLLGIVSFFGSLFVIPLIAHYTVFRGK